MQIAAVAIGSNLGDRETFLELARTRLGVLLADCQTSSIYETEPVGVPYPQPRFLNAAAVGRTTLGARELLSELFAIERLAGRTRLSPVAARTLDLDLILLGDELINDEGLIVPHPRFRDRRFVLEPLAEIAPGLRDPVTGKTVAELLRKLVNG